MKYLITGGSGYIGSRLVDLLLGREDTEKIVIADVKPPAFPRVNVDFHRTDVRDRGAVHALLEKAKPDTLVHLAFVLNPIHDEAAMYDIDVNGTQHVLDAASAAGTPQVLVTSSTTAYGAFADNPEPIEEDWVLRGHPTFAYARHKTDSDKICQLWAAQHTDRTMTIVRPCIVLGPNVENYIVRAWEQPLWMRIRGVSSQNVQFIHEDDLVEAITGLLLGKHAGPFNATGEGVLTWDETAELAGMKARQVPFGFLHRLNGFMWKIKQAESPPGNLDFIRYPWVCSNAKLKAALTDWKPRDSRATFLETLKARGLPKSGAGAGVTVGASAIDPATPSSSHNGHGAEEPAEVT